MCSTKLNNPKVQAFIAKLQRSGVDSVPKELIQEFINVNNI